MKWASRTVAQKLITQPVADDLPLLSRCLQLPIPIGVDLLLTPASMSFGVM